MERVDNMKSHVLGNGTSQCLLCGEEFGLLGASASECEECSKVAISVLLVSCSNLSFSFSHLVVLVTQISHQNECDHAR